MLVWDLIASLDGLEVIEWICVDCIFHRWDILASCHATLKVGS